MKIVVSSPTRFHLYSLARELADLGEDVTVITVYPRSKLDVELRRQAECAPWLAPLTWLAGFAAGSRFQVPLEWELVERFDRWAANRLDAADVVVALSGRGLRTLRAAHGRRSLAVCDRGSAHVEFQDRVLAEEHARWGVPYRHIDPRGISKELAEYAEADLITVPSTFAGRTFLDHGTSSSRVAVVPYGVDLSRFTPASDSRTGENFRVFFAGRVSLRKGFPYLLEAAKTMARLPGFSLVVAGSHSPEVEGLLAGTDRWVRYVGHVDPKRLAEFHRRASVFVMPSIEEGMPVVLLQAMASGVPVIATPNSGAEDLITDGTEGFIVPPRSAQAISERLTLLYGDPALRATMGQAARARVENFGGWSAYARRALDVYKRGRRPKEG
jgi:glycosyltransferase involved in cell wall biosynthesis